jgi:hypothetical protein
MTSNHVSDYRDHDHGPSGHPDVSVDWIAIFRDLDSHARLHAGDGRYTGVRGHMGALGYDGHLDTVSGIRDALQAAGSFPGI